MDNKTFDELVSSMYEAATIHRLLRVARAAKAVDEIKETDPTPEEYNKWLMNWHVALDALSDALKEVERLL